MYYMERSWAMLSVKSDISYIFSNCIRGKMLILLLFPLLLSCIINQEVHADTASSKVEYIEEFPSDIFLKSSTDDTVVSQKDDSTKASLGKNNIKQKTTEKTSADGLKLECLGEFKITAYDASECLNEKGELNNTSSGKLPVSSHTVAVDPNVIPMGSRLVIDGTEYVAEDTGARVKDRVIDIYFDTHEETENFGKQQKTVYLVLD